MSGNFYRDFEEKYRGSRELIKSRLRVYLPFVEPLKGFYEHSIVTDLGCGRGEWLELMGEAGFEAEGVDLDDAMLAACRELKLNILQYDVQQFLKSQPDSSKLVVSGFHIAEHLPFEDLQLLVREALRVLKPGGLLILETPNPENIIVGTLNFYLDPSHHRPIPPLLLSFLAEYEGFERSKTLRLQEAVGLKSPSARTTLINVLGGVSPDYAVVAQKGGNPHIAAATAAAFESDHGLTLKELAMRYQLQAEARIHGAEVAVRHATAKVQLAEARAEQAEARAEHAIVRAEMAEALARHVEAGLNAIYRGRSWHITWPLRFAARKYRQMRSFAFFLLKKLLKPLLKNGLRFILSRPALQERFLPLVSRYPRVERRLRGFAESSGLTAGTSTAIGERGAIWPNEQSELTSRARRIYIELSAAISRKKENR